MFLSFRLTKLHLDELIVQIFFDSTVSKKLVIGEFHVVKNEKSIKWFSQLIFIGRLSPSYKLTDSIFVNIFGGKYFYKGFP